MKSIRTQVVVALASSAVLASGLSVAAVAAGSAATSAVPVAAAPAPAASSSPDVTIYDG